MKRWSDLFLIIVFVLSLLTIPAANYWDAYKVRFGQNQFILESEEKVAALAQQFNANCSVRTRLQKALQKTHSELAKLPQPFGQNGAFARKALMNNIPGDWIASDSILYLFKLDQSRFRTLTGKGLEKNGSAFIATILKSLYNWDKLSQNEKTRINNRLDSLLGARVSGEMLLNNRSGYLIDVVFNGERRVLYWDFLSFSGKTSGAFWFFLKDSPRNLDGARLTLEEIDHLARGRFGSVLMPVESLQKQLKPLFAASTKQDQSILHLMSLFARKKEYSGIASISAGIMHENTFVYRSTCPRFLPYEMWFSAIYPSYAGISASNVVLVAIIIFWALLLLARVRRGAPFEFTVKTRLLGLVFMVGVLPVSALIIAGYSVIEQDHHARFRAMIAQAKAELRQADGNSTSLRMNFEVVARKFLADETFKKALTEKKIDRNSSAFRKCFAEFADAGVALEAIGIMNFGREDLLITSGETALEQDKGKLYFFSPMMYAGLKDFSEKNYQAAMKKLSESQRLGFETYQALTGTSVFSDMSLARQLSFFMTFGDSGHFIVFDFIAKQKDVVAAVIFFAPAAIATANYARKAIVRATRNEPDRLWGMAEKRSGNIVLSLPENRKPHPMENWFLKQLYKTCEDSCVQVKSEENVLAVCVPCENIMNVALGCTMSLDHLWKKTRQQYLFLYLVMGLLVFVLTLITAGLISFFIYPLQIIENGFGKIMQRDFDFRLNLQRDDELGDVAMAFNGMAQGLSERYQLAQFVSGTLSSRLEDDVRLEKKPQIRWGVVLASDIRNFTTLSEMHAPEEIVEMLNCHLESMSQHIIGKGGKIDKFIGDAIIAVFYNEDRTLACKSAVDAAIAMMSAHGTLVGQRAELGKFGYGIGIGLASGELFEGSYGAGERHEFSLTGLPRNLSEKLEAESKVGKFSHIVVSPQIKEMLPEVAFAELENSQNFEVII